MFSHRNLRHSDDIHIPSHEYFSCGWCETFHLWILLHSDDIHRLSLPWWFFLTHELVLFFVDLWLCWWTSFCHTSFLLLKRFLIVDYRWKLFQLIGMSASVRWTVEYASIFPSCWNNTWPGLIAENQWIFLIFSNSLEWFLQFVNEIFVLSSFLEVFLQWNKKKCVSLDVYLFTLMIHKWDSSASSTWFGLFPSEFLVFSQFSVFKL